MTEQEFIELLSTPIGFATLKLNIDLSPKQMEILDSWYSPNKTTRISCCLCNSAGKTSVIATVIALYTLLVLDGKVLYTSATWKQVHTQFLSSIKKYAHLFPSNWKFLDTGITIDNIPRLICISTSEESNYQGHHSTDTQQLVIITDESAGLPESVFRAVDRCSPHSLVVLGSPLGVDNYFYKIENDPKIYDLFKHFKVTQFECPWVTKEQIDVMIQKWGREHELILSSVFAEFTKNTENGILSLASWNDCINNPPEFISGERRVTLDFAAGGDESVLAYKNGNKCELIKCWIDKDTMSTAGAILIELNKLKNTTGLRQEEVWGDGSGLGKPILDKLYEEGWKCNYYFNQSKPTDEHYKNGITECYLELCKQIVNKSIIIPDDNELKMQLLSRRQRLNSSGKMELESKKELKSRGSPSPDRADAIAMLFIKQSTGTLSKIIPYVPQNNLNKSRFF